MKPEAGPWCHSGAFTQYTDVERDRFARLVPREPVAYRGRPIERGDLDPELSRATLKPQHLQPDIFRLRLKAADIGLLWSGCRRDT